MKNSILFGNYGGEGNLKEGMGGCDDVGELREEEIVWGEGDISHQPKEAEYLVAVGVEKPVAESVGGGNRRAMGKQRSMLSRQMEMMEASTWSAGDQTFMAAASKIRPGKALEHERLCKGEMEVESSATRHAMDKLIPPHELLARQYAASASFSVLHGAGRTLKGMDLCRLRNEVWRQTGFVD